MLPEIAALIDRALPAIAALAGVALTQWSQARRDRSIAVAADRRARRDAKLERLRAAFLRVILSGWGFQTAAVDLRHSSKVNWEALSTMVDEATVGLNEARARLVLERDVEDVLAAFDKARSAFSMLQLNLGDHETGAQRAPTDEIVKDYNAVIAAVKEVELAANAHMKRVEESPI